MKCWDEESCNECEWEECCIVKGGQWRDAEDVAFNAKCFGVSLLMIVVTCIVVWLFN